MPFGAARAAADRHSPTVEQAVLADFVGEGHFARHVRRMRRLYAERQQVLLHAFDGELGDRLEVAPSAAGMHLVAWLPRGVDDERVSARALEAGVEASPLSRYAVTRLDRGGLVLGWAAYAPDQIRGAVRRLAAVVR